MVLRRPSSPKGGPTIGLSRRHCAPAIGGLAGALAMLLIAGCAGQADPPAPLIASDRLSSGLDRLIEGTSDLHTLQQFAAADRSTGSSDHDLVAAAPSMPRPPPPRPPRPPAAERQSDRTQRPPPPPVPKPELRRQVAWIPKLKPWPEAAPERWQLAQAAPRPSPPKPPPDSRAKANVAAIMPAAGPTLPLLRPPTVQIAGGAFSRAAADAVAVGGGDAGLGALSMAAREALLAGDPATALGLYEQLATIVPNQRTALLGRAIALGRLGQRGEARVVYQALLEADPDDLTARMAYLGLLAEVAPEQALRELKQLARRHPDDARLLGQIGLAEAGRGDLARGVAALRRAVALDPMNPAAPDQPRRPV